MSNTLYGVQPKVRREGLGGGDTSELETVVNVLVGFPGGSTTEDSPPTAAQMNAGTEMSVTVARTDLGGLTPSWVSKTVLARYVVNQNPGTGGDVTISIDGTPIDGTGVQVTIGASYVLTFTPSGNDWSADDTVDIQYQNDEDQWVSMFEIPVLA